MGLFVSVYTLRASNSLNIFATQNRPNSHLSWIISHASEGQNKIAYSDMRRPDAHHYNNHVGQWCGSVGKAVASDTRGPWFESHHRQSLYWILNTVYCQLYWKDKYKEKGAGNGPFFIITMQNSANNYGSLSSSKLCGLPNLTKLENGINLTLRSRGGQVVSVLAFYSVDLSLNTAEKSTILLYINC